MAQKNDRRRKSESEGGLGGGVLGGDGPGQKRKRNKERNPDVYPHLRVMESFWDFHSIKQIRHHVTKGST